MSELQIKGKKRGVGRSMLLAEIALVVFISLVLIGLFLAYYAPGTETSSSPALQNLTLLSGSASSRSLNSSCAGDATLEMEVTNPTSVTLHISSVAIFGSNLRGNATTLLSVANSCLTLADSNPAIAASSSYLFDGYVNESLAFGSTYHYWIQLDNGQIFNGTLVAQL